MSGESEADRPHADVPRVVKGTPSDEEIAAITAVFAQLIAEREAGDRRLEPPPAASGWARSRRAMRDGLPLRRGWETR